MNIHYLQHVPFEGLGSIATWADSKGHHVTATRLYGGERLPEIRAIDLLVVLGGPMSANDEKVHPWLCEEKRFLERVVDKGVPALGICLGAQLLASVLGARVYANRCKEIGWFPVESTEAAATAPLFSTFPRSLPVFHWHGETFDLPVGAIHLARSSACEHQAFSFGKAVLALQFHFEITPSGVVSLLANCGEELQSGPFVQRAGEMLGDLQLFAGINNRMHSVLQLLTQASAVVAR